MPRTVRTEKESIGREVEKHAQLKNSKVAPVPFHVDIHEVNAHKASTNFSAISSNIASKLNYIIEKENSWIPIWDEKRYITSQFLSALFTDTENIEYKIAIVAPVSAGKSTVLNAICEYPILPAASGTTSSVPTYITRVETHGEESVTVYPLDKIVEKATTASERDSIKFQRRESAKKTYKAKEITKEFFKELLDYTLLVMRGDGEEHPLSTIENFAYFMASTEAVDVEFDGMDYEKTALQNGDFALLYENPRHRLMLLLSLLCVYVGQNENFNQMSEYKKKVNVRRKEIMRKYGLPVDEDYCVCLDWCSNSIPRGAILIDLPGTGSATVDNEKKSAHSELVKGILFEADALWVLASDNGTVQEDLRHSITDAVEMFAGKNKVCIYNCKNERPNDATPIREFIEKLPCLAGERCYVLNALAGECLYTQNGVKAENTRLASKRRTDGEEDTADVLVRKLQVNYAGINGKRIASYPTYITKRENGVIDVLQEPNVSYTLEAFFKEALIDYVARLQYEIVLKAATERVKAYIDVRKGLLSTLEILEGIKGKGPVVTQAVQGALRQAYQNVISRYSSSIQKQKKMLDDTLKSLSAQIGKEIRVEFGSDYSHLISSIHAEWRTLVTPGHSNAMTTNMWGNYPLKGDHPNWTKFKNVRDNVDGLVSITAFRNAVKVKDRSIEQYRTSLETYVKELKRITLDFKTDYIDAFSSEFKAQRDAICLVQRGGTTQIVNDSLWGNFNDTQSRLIKAINSDLDTLCSALCKSFECLTERNGIFDKVCSSADSEFKKKFSDDVLDALRQDIREKFTALNKIVKLWGHTLHDCVKPGDINSILLNDFTGLETTSKTKLDRIVDAVYGMQVGTAVNFPRDLSGEVDKFNAAKITGPNGAEEAIKTLNASLVKLIGFGVEGIVDIKTVINDVKSAINTWDEGQTDYREIGEYLLPAGNENIEWLFADYHDQLMKFSTFDEVSSDGK